MPGIRNDNLIDYFRFYDPEREKLIKKLEEETLDEIIKSETKLKLEGDTDNPEEPVGIITEENTTTDLELVYPRMNRKARRRAAAIARKEAKARALDGKRHSLIK